MQQHGLKTRLISEPRLSQGLEMLKLPVEQKSYC